MQIIRREGILRSAVAMMLATFLAGVGVLAGSAPVRAGQSAGPAEVPADIDSTGSQDVTGALQAFLDSVPDGSTVGFPPGAVYRIDGSLRLEDRHDMVIDARGATFRAVDQGGLHRAHWKLVGGSELVLRNMVIEGANPHAGLDDRAYNTAFVGQHGVRIDGTDRVEIDNLTITDVYGDFLYLGRSSPTTWASNIWVHDSRFERNGRQGIAVVAGRDVLIEGNTIVDARRASIDLEPKGEGWGAVNIHIVDNRIGPSRLRFISGHGAGPVNDVVIADNELVGRVLRVDVKAPPAQRRSGFFVLNNTSDETFVDRDDSPIVIRNFDGVVVRGNSQPMSSAETFGVRAGGSCAVEVEGNDFGPAGQLHDDGRSCFEDPVPARPPAPEFGAAAAPAPPSAAPTVPDPADGSPADLTPLLVAAGGSAAVALVVGASLRRRSRRPAN